MGCGLTISEGWRVRLLREADAAELHGLIEANRDRLSRWFAWGEGQTFKDTRAFLRGAEAQVERNDGFQAAIVPRSASGQTVEEGSIDRGGAIAGVVGFPFVDWRRRTTRIGYWLDREQEGRGTMTAVVRVLTQHALAVWGLNRVEIRAAAENRRSRAIPERLGFRQEGTLRQAELVGDRRLDSVVYSLLAGEAGRIVPEASQLQG
jgi:ribosomal-protein-serine acetyltransferase